MRSYFDKSKDPRLTFAPVPSDTIDARVLAANTSETTAIPAGSLFVVFSGTADFYAKFGTSGVTAAVPAADVTNGTASELNPAVRRIPEGATHIALISGVASVVTLSYYGS